MKIKVYLQEWFYNSGIVGFLRILDKAEDNFVTVSENYIEFDTEDLRKFDNYYFLYFFNIYNVAKKLDEKMEKSFKLKYKYSRM